MCANFITMLNDHADVQMMGRCVVVCDVRDRLMSAQQRRPKIILLDVVSIKLQSLWSCGGFQDERLTESPTSRELSK